MDCTTTDCGSPATEAVAFPMTTGDLYVGGYCDEHAADILTDMRGASRVTGTAIRAEVDRNQGRGSRFEMSPPKESHDVRPRLR